MLWIFPAERYDKFSCFIEKYQHNSFQSLAEAVLLENLNVIKLVELNIVVVPQLALPL